MKAYRLNFNKKLKGFIPALVAFLIFTQFVAIPIANKYEAKAENTVAQEEISQTEQELNAIIEQQKQIQQQIKDEEANQGQLENDAAYIESVIKANDLEVQNLTLELQRLELEIKKNGEDKAEIEARLEEIKGNVNDLNEELAEYNNLLYKMSFNTPSILDDKSTFQDTVIGQEKVKAVVRLIEADLAEIERLEKEAAAKNDELAKKEEELGNLQGEKLAQSSQLQAQKDGLEWQKQNKEKLALESKDKQADLIQSNEDLNAKIAEYTSKLNQLRSQALALPPSGNQVTEGQLIGLEGRTGYVCGYLSPEQLATIPPEDYAISGQYCAPPLYFLPDIDKYPTIGAHLHFEYKIGSEWVDPSAHFDEFDRLPMDGLTITQGFHGGHYANDMDAGYGAPVYAVKPGQVQYFCDYLIPSNPAYGAVVVHDDGTRTLYWHLQRTGSSPPCTTLNYYGY